MANTTDMIFHVTNTTDTENIKHVTTHVFPHNNIIMFVLEVKIQDMINKIKATLILLD